MFSALWAARANSGRVKPKSNNSFIAVATAHSSAALEESPAPRGTWPSTKISIPVSIPRDQSTPIG